ncbi:MAG TPA: right-handed parallel beta-helix repeat-containing protein [Steroidobacteraceae bacterium]|jgi:hypothetical protein|nr:right-handed parallel beta-helix repeat-containing protein [Steroidobacteraceae bacterium]
MVAVAISKTDICSKESIRRRVHMQSKKLVHGAAGIMAIALSSGGSCSSAGDPVSSAALVSASGGGSAASSSGPYALPADRATEWSYAGMLSKGGIPSAGWPVCNSKPLAPLGGGKDDGAAINGLIQSCRLGSVVQLGAGTFTMGRGTYIALNRGVVLRGQGAGVTILTNPVNLPSTPTNKISTAGDNTPIIIMGAGRWVNPDGDARCQGLTAYQPKYMQLLSADAAKDASSVTVINGSIFSPGMIVLLDETSGASWQPDPVQLSTFVWAQPDYALVWMFHNPPFGGDDGKFPLLTPAANNNFAGIGSGSDAACWFSRQDRPQSEIKEIASVSGNTLTFTSPLHKQYLKNRFAELTTFTGGNTPVRNAGIENLTATRGGNSTIAINSAAYSWVKNVEVSDSWGDGIGFSDAFRVEVRDSYIHDMAYPNPGGAGYIIAISTASTEILAENNILLKGNKVMVARSGGAGSVVAYNYADDGYIGYNSAWQEIGVNGSHMLGSHHMLFEGNRTFNLDSDGTHGGSSYSTYFRNWATSQRADFTNSMTGALISDSTQRNSPFRAAGLMRYTNYMSFVGNVLGIKGVTTAANGYVDETARKAPTIWFIGWNDASPYVPDPTVAKTVIRDGNWDWFLSQQTWLNSPPASLPDSLYLSCKPAFMGANTWPWVDPKTGTTYTLPAKARYDAGTPNKVPVSGDSCGS